MTPTIKCQKQSRDAVVGTVGAMSGDTSDAMLDKYTEGDKTLTLLATNIADRCVHLLPANLRKNTAQIRKCEVYFLCITCVFNHKQQNETKHRIEIQPLFIMNCDQRFVILRLWMVSS